MIDYSGFAFPKQRVKALEQQDKATALESKDKAENAKARKRAKGQCEVQECAEVDEPHMPRTSRPLWRVWRCAKKDTQTHHLIGGIGRRNKGKSILADYKLRVCDQCHDDITRKILQPTTAEHTAATVRYRRVR